jgi:hypothetical protein
MLSYWSLCHNEYSQKSNKMAMNKLMVWPIPNDDLPIDQSHLIVTFGPPISRELRSKRMTEFFSCMNTLEGWSYYIPDKCVTKITCCDDDVYGALYSSSDMYVFDVILHQVREMENKKAFESKNNIAFSSLITLDKRDWSMGYLANRNGKKSRKKVQMVLVNRKPRVNIFMKQKWEREKLERKEAMKTYMEEYKNRLMTDEEFAKREEGKRCIERERERLRKMEKKNEKQRNEDLNVLFENFFGENKIWGPISESYRTKFHTAYMPIGEGRFLHKHTIWRKENFYVKKIGGNMERIKDTLRQCHIQFADGKVLPINPNDFEVWYRRLPIHKMFLQGKESEIHYLAPDKEQPDFPFVYVDWNIDCELSEKGDYEEDDETRISSNVHWDWDVNDHVDY